MPRLGDERLARRGDGLWVHEKWTRCFPQNRWIEMRRNMDVEQLRKDIRDVEERRAKWKADNEIVEIVPLTPPGFLARCWQAIFGKTS